MLFAKQIKLKIFYEQQKGRNDEISFYVNWTFFRLASLHMYQHALAANGPGSKVTIKMVEKEYGLERFVPLSLADSMKKKEMQKLLAHFLKLNSNLLGPGTY